MKTLMLTVIMLAATLGLGSCEKVNLEEGEDKKENIKDDNGNQGASDINGGWINPYDDEDENDDGDEIHTGDVLDVATFRHSAIYTQVWVEGYIVGAATGKNQNYRYEFGPEFTFDTAILLADDANADDINDVISVCLPKGSRRSELNLKDNPQNYGKRIAVFGFQATYLKIPGIKQIDGYQFPLE